MFLLFFFLYFSFKSTLLLLIHISFIVQLGLAGVQWTPTHIIPKDRYWYVAMLESTWSPVGVQWTPIGHCTWFNILIWHSGWSLLDSSWGPIDSNSHSKCIVYILKCLSKHCLGPIRVQWESNWCYPYRFGVSILLVGPGWTPVRVGWVWLDMAGHGWGSIGLHWTLAPPGWVPNGV